MKYLKLFENFDDEVEDTEDEKELAKKWWDAASKEERFNAASKAVSKGDMSPNTPFDNNKEYEKQSPKMKKLIVNLYYLR